MDHKKTAQGSPSHLTVEGTCNKVAARDPTITTHKMLLAKYRPECRALYADFADAIAASFA